jgi:hypothetical protein
LSWKSSVFRTIDSKFEGAGEFLNIRRIHPSGVGNFLSHVFGIKGEFDGHFIAPVKRIGGGIVAIVESIYDCVVLVVESELEVAGIAGKDFAVTGYIGE